jgi:hypothetical protein
MQHLNNMVNRTRIRVGYEEPFKNLYYGLDVMLMGFDVDMVPIQVAMRGTLLSCA